jgi:hypothetical protein
MKTQLNEIYRMQQLAGLINEGFQGDDNEGDGLSGFRGNINVDNDNESTNDVNLIAKNREERLKYAGEGAKAFIKGVMLDYGPYKDETFESDWWRKGWEQAELAYIKRQNK